MANLDQIVDYLADKRVQYVNGSATTGSAQYQNYYYADMSLDVPTGSVIIGAFVDSSTSNRPAFVTRTTSGLFRVWSPFSSTVISVRIAYILGGGA